MHILTLTVTYVNMNLFFGPMFMVIFFHFYF